MRANIEKIGQVVDVARLVAAGASAADAGAAFIVWGAGRRQLVASAGWTSSLATSSEILLNRMVAARESFALDGTMCAVIRCDDSGGAAVVVDGPNVPATQRVYSEFLGVLANARGRYVDDADCLTGYKQWILSPNPRRDLVSALERVDWNVSALADEWGVSRPTLYRAIRDCSINLDRAPVAARRLARKRASRL